VQDPEELLPLTTSQYEPSASDVVKVALHAKSSLLMATKPAEPEIFCENGYPVTKRKMFTSSKSYLIRLRRNPVGYRRSANGVAETSHSRDCIPTMLAKPSISAAYPCARTNT